MLRDNCFEDNPHRLRLETNPRLQTNTFKITNALASCWHECVFNEGISFSGKYESISPNFHERNPLHTRSPLLPLVSDPRPYQMEVFARIRCGWHTDLNKRYDFKRQSCVDGFMSHWVNKICVHLRYGEHISAVCLLSAGVKLGPPYCRELLKCMN